VDSVNQGLAYFAEQPESIKNLMGRYVHSLATTSLAAQCQNHYMNIYSFEIRIIGVTEDGLDILKIVPLAGE